MPHERALTLLRAFSITGVTSIFRALSPVPMSATLSILKNSFCVTRGSTFYTRLPSSSEDVTKFVETKSVISPSKLLDACGVISPSTLVDAYLGVEVFEREELPKTCPPSVGIFVLRTSLEGLVNTLKP